MAAQDDQGSVTAVVTGTVQGVFFRASTLEQAQQLGLTGWVKNLPDDSVELRVQGAREDVEALIRWAHRGPPAAKVEGIYVTDANPDPDLKTFRIDR